MYKTPCRSLKYITSQNSTPEPGDHRKDTVSPLDLYPCAVPRKFRSAFGEPIIRTTTFQRVVRNGQIDWASDCFKIEISRRAASRAHQKSFRVYLKGNEHNYLRVVGGSPLNGDIKMSEN